jgi:hypothetical protein
MTSPQTRTRARRGRRLPARMAETILRRPAARRTGRSRTPQAQARADGPASWRQPGRDTEPATYVITCSPGKPGVITREPAGRDLEAGS